MIANAGEDRGGTLVPDFCWRDMRYLFSAHRLSQGMPL